MLSCLGTGRVVIWDLQTGTRFDSFPWGSGSASQAGRIWDVTWNPRPPPGSALVSGFSYVLGFPMSEYWVHVPDVDSGHSIYGGG